MSQQVKSATLYSQNNCAACLSALGLLTSAGYTVQILKLEDPGVKTEFFEDFPLARSVPKVIIKDSVKLENVAELKAYLSEN